MSETLADCTVREARPADAVALHDIYLRAYAHAFPWRALPISLAADSAGEWMLVACRGERLLGFISSQRDHAFIHHLYVDPAFHGRGIGRALLQACLAGLSHRPAALKCVLKNRAALAFYARHGWTAAAAQPADAQDYVLLHLN
ncbi:GNAT family N-acetyltransferase [Roseateles toxinivorans]|uniref:Ribosomal protein S18 acetylase RimI-like enzyme n=1 Tax=Roseateles toxinivorans TaxID=270368 RepID=A0A4R6QBT8_9BURK|nr:GNAT family N-acetyltransferase [Roseateles toxinivorans]TDP59745.1 ribosomal protein S18 acetylase RimI-like enzyme [Roseateles toxinivorans]